MADNTEETKPADTTAKSPESQMTEDENFTYWLIMLPFLATACVFIFKYSNARAEDVDLLYAVGAVVIGILVASFSTELMQGGKKKEESTSTDETTKKESAS